MKRFLLLFAMTGLLSSSVIVLNPSNTSAKPVPQICGYCNGGGPECWERDPFTGQWVHC